MPSKIGNIIFIVLSIILICLTRNKKRENNRIINIIFVLIIGIGFFLLVGDSLLYFDSPEEAFNYSKNEEAKLIIEGKTTDYVLGENNRVVLEKNEKGWRIPFSQVETKKYSKQIGSISIYVMRYKLTNEYYVIVWDMSGKAFVVSDNCNSKFYSTEGNGELSDSYYAYVYDINEKYTISINEEKITLE